jgi:uncharacterized membrane protein YfcA
LVVRALPAWLDRVHCAATAAFGVIGVGGGLLVIIGARVFAHPKDYIAEPVFLLAMLITAGAGVWRILRIDARPPAPKLTAGRGYRPCLLSPASSTLRPPPS